MANTTSALNPEYWSAMSLIARNDRRQIAQTVTWPLESEIADGDTVNFPVYSNFDTGDANDDGTDNTLSDRSFSTQSLVIDQHKYAGAHYGKKELKQIAANQQFEDTEIALMGESLMKKIEVDILTAMLAGAGTSITAASGITKDVLRDIVRRFDGLETPKEERYLVVDEYGKEDVLAIEGFTKINESGGEAEQLLRNGEVVQGYLGEIYGLKILVSVLVPPTATSPVKRRAVAYSGNSFGLALQDELDVNVQYMARKIGADVVADSLYGVKVLRSTEIFEIVLG